MPVKIEGNFSANTKRYAVAVSRWNGFVVERLVEGALDALERHGVPQDNISIAYCPGGFELPLVVQKLARTGKFDAVIALGAVIRGATPHFDFVASEAAKGIGSAALNTGIPCLFGVLTTDTVEQAIERAGTKAGNKGFEAAMAALEMTILIEKIDSL